MSSNCFSWYGYSIFRAFFQKIKKKIKKKERKRTVEFSKYGSNELQSLNNIVIKKPSSLKYETKEIMI